VKGESGCVNKNGGEGPPEEQPKYNKARDGKTQGGHSRKKKKKANIPGISARRVTHPSFKKKKNRSY